MPLKIKSETQRTRSDHFDLTVPQAASTQDGRPQDGPSTDWKML